MIMAKNILMTFMNYKLMNSQLYGGILFLYIFAVFFVSCQKSEKENFEYPVLETEKPVLNGKDKHSAIDLTARIVLDSKEDFDLKGFVYDLQKKPLYELNNSIKAERINRSSFSASITGALKPDTTYYVRAFLRNGNTFIYGNEVSFRYRQAEPAVLNSVTPPKATLGDTLIITGQGFGFKARDNTVMLGLFDADVIQSTEDSLWVVVPDSIHDYKNQITAKIFGQKAENTLSFELKEPLIKSVSQSQGSFPDTICIKGENFSPIHSWVKFGKKRITPTKVSHNEIKWVVPFSKQEETKELSLSQMGREFMIEKEFKFLEQTIDSISANEIWIYDSIEVFASNIDFTRLPECKVYVGSKSSPIVEKENGKLTFYIRVNDYKKESYSLKINTTDTDGEKINVFETSLIHKPLQIISVENPEIVYGENLYVKVGGFYSGYFLHENIADPEIKGSRFYLGASKNVPMTIDHFYNMIPGNYHIWFKDGDRHSKKEIITVVEPELTYIEPIPFARGEHHGRFEANNLPEQGTLSLNHQESGRRFILSTSFSNHTYSAELIGEGLYDAGFNLGGVFFDSGLDIEVNDYLTHAGHFDKNLYSINLGGFGFKMNNKIYAGFGSYWNDSGEPISIDLNTRETKKVEPLGEEVVHSCEFFNGEIYAPFKDKVYRFNADQEIWGKEQYEFGTDTIHSLCTVNNRLYAFSYSGNVYIKGSSWSLSGNHDVIRDHTFKYAYHHDGNIYSASREGIKILSLDTWKIVEEHPVQWQRLGGAFYSGFHSIKHAGDVYLFYRNTGSTGANVLIKKFSIAQNQWVDIQPDFLPGYGSDYEFLTNEEGNVFMLNNGYIYTFNP